VNAVVPGLFALARTPEQMAALPVARIQAAIRSCGLAPAKAKHIRALSRLLVERHGGQVPKTFAELEALPGVGHKTASVVRVQAFGIPAFPVDTHIHRLAARWGLSSGRSVVQTERDLTAVFPETTWGKRHLQIIYFGREHCPARAHDAAACLICSWASPGRKRSAAPTSSRRRAAAHRRRHQQQAHQRRVERDRGGDAEAHLFDVDEVAGHEGAHDHQQDQRGAGDGAAGARESADHAGAVVAGPQSLLADALSRNTS
jgi:endonuclease-3